MSLGITQGQIDSGLPLFPFVTPVGNNIWTRKIQQMPKYETWVFVGYSWTPVSNPKAKCAFKDCPLGEL